jgi:protein TonB
VVVSPVGVAAQRELEPTNGSNVVDTAALETVKSWRFIPARRAGDPVAAWVFVPVVFRLASGP